MSSRWYPQVGPRVSVTTGRSSPGPATSVTWSQVAPSAVWQFAVYKCGYVTHGVATDGGGGDIVDVRKRGLGRRCPTEVGWVDAGHLDSGGSRLP